MESPNSSLPTEDGDSEEGEGGMHQLDDDLTGIAWRQIEHLVDKASRGQGMDSI